MQLFVEQLTNVDFSYLDPQRGLVGETWLASVALDGVLDEQGMVCDFGIVKKLMRNWLDDEVDHRLVVPLQSPNLTLHHNQDTIDLSWQFGDQTLQMQAPREAVTLIDCELISAESVATFCRQQLIPLFPNQLDQLTLDFVCEEIKGECYHYSHGLKKHNGNCQRIAHGHRSRIEIYIDGQRHTPLEHTWSQTFSDIYLASEEDIQSQDENNYLFSYQAPQGFFQLSMPKACCHLLPTETTVEWIADYLAQQIKQDYPNQTVLVRAFEGINKGAAVAK